MVFYVTFSHLLSNAVLILSTVFYFHSTWLARSESTDKQLQEKASTKETEKKEKNLSIGKNTK